MQDFTTLTIPALVAETEAMANAAQAQFGQLTRAQFNWKPASDQWSVAQCLEHLLVGNRAMLAAIAAVAQGERPPTFWERMPLLPQWTGKFMIRAVSPQAKQKVKAPALIRPSNSTLELQLVQQFVAQQAEIARQLNALAAVPAERLVMTSPLMSVVTYTLLDAGRLMVAHERRHLLQAERVMHTPGFPQ